MKNNIIIQDEKDVENIRNIFFDVIKARTLDKKYDNLRRYN